MCAVAESLEFGETPVTVNVRPEEYARLLGYPRGHELEGRALDLAGWAREWYARHGRPWIYARQVETFALGDSSICLDGDRFVSSRFKTSLEQVDAHSAVLVAVGAGQEAEEEAQRLWSEEKPDEYFFLEMFASAVVESLTTSTGARLCDWAEQHGMAVLPHYSPGYPEWDIAEQPRLLQSIQSTRRAQFPSHLEAMDSGMLRPRKSQLAVFGLTRHTERFSRLTSLVPCESCSFGPCQYRRAGYRNPPRSNGERVTGRTNALDQDASYSVKRKALQRWASERLTLREHPNGSLDAIFRYDGTTCTNMGRPLQFEYQVRLGAREEGYPIREQHCVPAEGDTGHRHMCQYIANPESLMSAIHGEKPLQGQRLDAVFSWLREPNSAGCFCEQASRNHKWGLVLETIHYALAHKELAQDTEY
jgi:hypothetical protein